MYTRKSYEPERKLRIQIPGHGSAAGGSARGKTPRRSDASKKTWLSSGVFEDGYQFGDLTRGLHGTALEVHERMLAGVFDVAENTLDSVAGRVAGTGLWEEPLTEFVKKDLIDEEDVARKHVRYTSPLGWKGILFGIDPDRDSFLGDKAEGLVQSIGQMTLAKAVTLAGIPGEAVTAVNAYGAEMENAYRNGATPREANISASISAVGEVGTEMLSGAIKIGDTAVDDLLVKHLSDGISDKLLKGLAGAVVGGAGEGMEGFLSETISRFGQWITYMDDKTFKEMLWSGEAREAYMDEFLGGLLLGIPSGAAKVISAEDGGTSSGEARSETGKEQTAGPETDAGMVRPQGTAPAETGRTVTGPRAEDAPRRVQMGEPAAPAESGMRSPAAETMTDPDTRDTDASVPDRVDAPKTVRPEGDVPYFTSDHWTGELEGLWTQTRTASDTAIDMDRIYGPDSDADTGTVGQRPMGNADAQRQYLNGKTDLSRDADTAQTADRDVTPVKDSKAVPKPKGQIISELAPKIRTTNMTSGRAMIAAEQTYADAVKRFGPDAAAVLENIRQGQDPRRFLDGFQNAYILGKQGAGPDALNNSSAANYLTDSQRAEAYALGEQVRRGLENSGKTARIAPEGVAADPEMPYSVPLRREVKKAIIERGIRSKDTVFTYDTVKNPLATYAKRIPKMEGYYDVVMHGTDTAVWFFETKIDAYTLAQVIRQRPDYKKGTPIRLLSCSTGNTDNTGNCVAQLLANALGVDVIAPTEELYVDHAGRITIGESDCGEMKTFYSRRIGKYEEHFYK